jgi:hypothetical protein
MQRLLAQAPPLRRPCWAAVQSSQPVRAPRLLEKRRRAPGSLAPQLQAPGPPHHSYCLPKHPRPETPASAAADAAAPHQTDRRESPQAWATSAGALNGYGGFGTAHSGERHAHALGRGGSEALAQLVLGPEESL